MQVPHHVESVELTVVFKKRVSIVPITSTTKYTYAAAGINDLRKGVHWLGSRSCEGCRCP